MLKKLINKVELNPILIKETRQAVRSQAIIGTIILFLAILFLCAIFSMFTGFKGTIPLEKGIGKDLFLIISVIFTCVSNIILPLYMLTTFYKELQHADNELFFVTSLSPGQIIRGKYFSGLLVLTLIISLFFPFMLLSYFLRGISLPAIFLSILGISICSSMIQAFAFLLGALSRYVKSIVVKTIGIAAVITSLSSLTSMIWNLFKYSHFFRLNHSVLFPLGFFTIILIIFSLFFLLCAKALISDSMTNRIFPLRIFIPSGIFIITGLIFTLGYFMKRYYSEIRLNQPYEILFIISSIIISIFTFIGFCERHKTSRRVKYAIPKNKKLRFLSYPFYSGAQNGIVWGIITFSILLFIYTFALNNTPFVSGSIDSKVIRTGTVFFVHTLFYALVGLVIYRTFFKRSRDSRFTGVTSLCFAAFPLFLCIFLTNDLKNYTNKPVFGTVLSIFNPVIFIDAYDHTHMNFVLIPAGLILISLCLILIIVNLNWFIEGMQNFQPLREKAKLQEKINKLKRKNYDQKIN
ncbi:MAG: hypothetical protein U9O87_06200 [Verrucomicrobiota bacterium]|nr:hypothetical protein [Verrucomicrobiota bacterium]